MKAEETVRVLMSAERKTILLTPLEVTQNKEIKELKAKVDAAAGILSAVESRSRLNNTRLHLRIDDLNAELDGQSEEYDRVNAKLETIRDMLI